MTSNLHSTAVREGSVALPDWGVIRATGADARSFLHGQLTQDVLGLDVGEARLAGLCSPKGRLIASFVMWGDPAGDVLLACSADLLPATLKRLSMYVLRAKCRLVDASAELPLHGIVGAALPPGLPVWRTAPAGGGLMIRLPDAMGLARGLWIGSGEPPAPAGPGLQAWQWLEACSGVPRVVAATVDQFVPQMVNMELVGGVNFQKGCYPGQEVVARSQYRGTLKRRAFVLESAQAMTPGQEVFDAADPQQPAGMVVLAGSADGQRHAALAELKIASASSELHAGAADGPLLRLGTLPYPLPTGAA